ncbi:hypothetical protein CHUAL_003589 [Chamberlinius hualienensis]
MSFSCFCKLRMGHSQHNINPRYVNGNAMNTKTSSLKVLKPEAPSDVQTILCIGKVIPTEINGQHDSTYKMPLSIKQHTLLCVVLFTINSKWNLKCAIEMQEKLKGLIGLRGKGDGPFLTSNPERGKEKSSLSRKKSATNLVR